MYRRTSKIIFHLNVRYNSTHFGTFNFHEADNKKVVEFYRLIVLYWKAKTKNQIEHPDLLFLLFGKVDVAI